MPNYRDTQLITQSFDRLGEAIRRQREEDLYNRILNELDPPRAGTADGSVPTERPHSGGRIEFELWKQQQQMERQQENDELTQQLKRAQIQRALREPAQSRSGFLEAPYEAPEGMVWNGRMFVRNPAYGRATGGSGASTSDPADSTNKLEKELRRELGIGWGDIDKVIKQGVPVTPDNPDTKEREDENITFTTEAGVPMTLPRQKLLPYANRGLSLYRGNGNMEAPMSNVAPQTPAPAVSQPKKLDPATAKEILAEAGGDKQKAREIAKSRGYSF